MQTSQHQAQFYGRRQMIGLKSADGWLCYRWYASEVRAIILFSDPKVANEWLKVARTQAQSGEGGIFAAVLPSPLTAHPDDLMASINPAADGIEINRMARRFEWRNF